MSTPEKSKENEKPTKIDLPDAENADEIVNNQPVHSLSPDELRLERFGNNVEDVDDSVDMDDEDDEHDHITHHSLLGMLAGRLGQPRRRGSSHKYDSLHPVTSVLSVMDVDACYALEQSFPENERATREKFEYRLSRCPELSLGIFSQPTKAEAEKAGQPSKRELIAMIVSTRTSSPGVTDASMAFPQDWRTNRSSLPPSDGSDAVGHQDVGGTIALHSLVVSPEHRNKGLANVLLKSYVQRIKDSKIAERIALLTHSELEGFYGRFGFDNMGPSTSKHGSGGWINMVHNFSDIDDD